MRQLEVHSVPAGKVPHRQSENLETVLPSFPFSGLEPEIQQQLKAVGLNPWDKDQTALFFEAMEFENEQGISVFAPAPSLKKDQTPDEQGNQMLNTPQALKMFYETEKMRPVFEYSKPEKEFYLYFKPEQKDGEYIILVMPEEMLIKAAQKKSDEIDALIRKSKATLLKEGLPQPLVAQAYDRALSTEACVLAAMDYEPSLRQRRSVSFSANSAEVSDLAQNALIKPNKLNLN